MKHFPRGSEWRKWDLHVHTPNTKMENKYVKKEGNPDWERFCEIIHKSDVDAIGITDYFCADGYLLFINLYNSLYPNDEKVFFPNIEFRLNESVNKDHDEINLHVILDPEVSESIRPRMQPPRSVR